MEETWIKLDELLDIKARGAFIRSKAQWCDNGNKCNTIFQNLESKCQSSNVIENLEGCNGQTLHDDLSILTEITSVSLKLPKLKNAKFLAI